MKTLIRYILAALFFTLICDVVYGQNSDSVKKIIHKLKTGQVDSLTEYFANKLDLTLEDEEDTYNKSEAAEKLTVFFDTNTPKNFTVKHKGDAPDGAVFIIGTLHTSKGAFRADLIIRDGKLKGLGFEQ